MVDQATSSDPEAQTSDVRRRYGSPEALINDGTLSEHDKLALLKDWELELDNMLKAEEEGMSSSDPMRSKHEAQLAEECTRVKNALKALGPL